MDRGTNRVCVLLVLFFIFLSYIENKLHKHHKYIDNTS